MTQPFEDSVTLITGGGGHIGRATANSIAGRGGDLVLLDKVSDGLEGFCADLRSIHGVSVLILDHDLMQEDSFAAIAAAVTNRFGRLDHLVNNAAFYDEMPGWGVPFGQEGYAAWMAVMRVNLFAPFFLAQSLAPLLRASGRGAIVNVASIYGVVGPDFSLYAGTDMTNPAAYAASKGGLVQLSRWLATALAPKVRVNTVTPGGVARGQLPEFVERYEAKTPLGRMAHETDIAEAIRMLLEPGAGYVTGQNLMVDGGWTAW